MSLTPVILDDLTWSDLTTEALRRIPALSEGRWTLHAPVDPGITLVELYAWLLEQRLFWMNGTPDALDAGVLGLLGDTARGAIPAATVLYFQPSAAVTVPANTVMRPSDGDPRIGFSTTMATLVLPLAASIGGGTRPLIGLRGADVELGGELLAGRAVALFDGTVEMTITLRLTNNLTAKAGGEITLLLLLDQTGVPAEWSADAVADVPPPATLSWFYAGPAGARKPLPAVTDGTGGLRRSGIVRFTPPTDWQSAPAAADGMTYSLVLRADNAAFAAPPRLLGLWPNVAIARHQRVVSDTKTVAFSRLPGNSIALTQDEMPPIAETAFIDMTEIDGKVYRWTATADLGLHGRHDRVFTVDRAAGVLRFGDGEYGRLPEPAQGQANVSLTVTTGGGASGNFGAMAAWQPADDAILPPAVNVVPAEGGADPETMRDAKARAAGALRRVQRAVLPSDYETLARQTPGVAIARAHAAIGYHPAFPCQPVPGAVTVFVVPAAVRAAGIVGPRAVLIPDPGALQAAASHLDAARLLGAEVFVRPPVYVPVVLTVEVRADDAQYARQTIATRLATFLDPLTGGDDGTGWPFGEKLRPSALLHQAQDAIGPQGEVTRVAIGLPDAVPPVVSEDCKDVAIGLNTLPAAAAIHVAVLGPPETTGGLT